MRYGSRREYQEDELGKFGIGLKSASTSQCTRLTVATRSSVSQRRIHVRRWDLDVVKKHDQWAVEELDPEGCEDYLLEPLESRTGTVVLWENLDRVLDYRFPDGESARKGFLLRAEELEQHLAMVFHRFLAGEAAKYKKKLSITVNGAPVKPWDPFARSEKHTQQLRSCEFNITNPAGSGTVRFTGYVLPPKDKFSTPQAFEELGGPERWNKQQGFYIYRNDRMIQSGGWSWLRTPDEHTKLARASIDFSSRLDGAFKVNMAKERVTLPAELRDELKPQIDALVRRAQEAYRKSENGYNEPSDRMVGVSEASSPSGAEGHARGGADTAAVSSSIGRGEEVPRAKQIRVALERTAVRARAQAALKKIIALLVEEFPEVARALGY